MTGVKTLEYVWPDSEPVKDSVKLQEGERETSGFALSKDGRNQFDKWLIGCEAKESMIVLSNAVPRIVIDVLKKPTLAPVISNSKEYNRSKFLLTGLQSGGENKVEIALLSEGGGGGFADVMPAKDGFIITVPELFEFEGSSFSADEFLQAINAAKSQFQLRGTPIAGDISGGGVEKS